MDHAFWNNDKLAVQAAHARLIDALASQVPFLYGIILLLNEFATLEWFSTFCLY
jgi:hypothetical protein